MLSTILIYFLPIIFTPVFLIFWRKYTVWKDKNIKFPTRFHIILFFFVSLIPIIGIITFMVLLVVYVVLRVCDDISIKENKFSKYWFDK